MTTIAYKNGTMAADTRATTYQGVSVTCEKLFRKKIGKGRKARTVIIGVAGESSASLVFLDWYGTGATRPETLKDTDFSALVLEKDGLYEYDSLCRGEKVLDPCYAIGSGQVAAMAAMFCGKTARQAVEIAARLDPYTGGRIVSYRL